MGFTAMAPVHHAFDKYVGRYRNAERDGYAEMFELFEHWMQSDVPLAGRIFKEMTGDIFKRNLLVKGEFKVGGPPGRLGADRLSGTECCGRTRRCGASEFEPGLEDEAERRR